MRFFVLLLLFLITLSAKSQEVKVLDRETGFPIQNVTIYNDNRDLVVYSNKHGIADLSAFKDTDVISFNHLAFIEFEILKKELGIINFKVKLTNRSELLDEVVLSASRGKETRSRIAETISITSREDIKKIAPQTSADLLANLPGIKVQKTQMGGGSPVIRGMEANRVLLVVDGVRMNNAIYRTGHLQNSITVSPTVLERTEIIYGPSSVIYGSDALGGVINYFTKIPEINKENTVNTSISSRFSSVNDEKTMHLDLELGFSKWASFTAVSYSDFGDLKMGKTRNHGFDNWGKVYQYSNNTNTFYNPVGVPNSNPNLQKNTGYNQLDLLQKFYVPLNKKTDISFNFQYSTSSDIPNFDNLAEVSSGKLRYAEAYYGPQNRFLASTYLHINPDYSWLEKGSLVFAFQQIEESRIERRMNSLDRYYRYENVDVYSLNGDFTVPLNKAKNRNLSYGFEFTHNDVSSNAIGRKIAVNGNEINGFTNDFVIQSRYPDGGSQYSSAALYTNYRQDLSSKSTLNTGIRFTSTFLKALWVDDTFITLPDMDIYTDNKAVSATAGYVYKPSANWQISTLVSSGFRSPNIDDIGKIRYKNGQVTVPNIYLKPEYVYNSELGIMRYFNEKNFLVSANVYYTLLHNYIARGTFEMNGEKTLGYDGVMATTMANINNKNAYITGGTFSFQGTIANHFKSNGSVTYTKGRSYDKKLPLSSIPPLFGNLEVSYNFNKFQTGLNYRFNAAKKLNDYNLEEGIDNIEQTPFIAETGNYYGTPKWSTLNLNTNYQFSDKVSISFRIDNIFDVHFKEFASSISSPGRNYMGSVLLKL
ncbi:TonB-dependent receptor plug domain-containing protein [Lutibacter sp.]|uniref:TonB-dependent receptor plug domain-containing protein n=1 Tax=Lutibacter sp. TaxID=1925666 RepID=UPI0035680C40